LQREGDRLRINPCIPKDWSGYEIHYRFGNTTYHLRVENSHGQNGNGKEITVDGKNVGDEIMLEDDGLEHHVIVALGREAEGARRNR
jgi:cellobiose phosphorylase